MEATILWTARSTNAKNGDVPQGFIGRTRVESMRTCEKAGCPMRPTKYGGDPDSPRCYSQCGTPGMAHSAMCKAHAKGKRYDLTTALEQRAPDAKIVRLGAVGDPVGCPEAIAEAIPAIQDAGLTLIGYTHAWRTMEGWQCDLMASCDSLAEADEAAAAGWRCAVVLDGAHEGRTWTTPGGAKGVVCPAMMAPGKVTCNSCRLCDPARSGPHVGFPDHGPGSVRRGR